MRHTKQLTAAVGLLVLGGLMSAAVQGAARLDPRRLPPTTRPQASTYQLPPALAVLAQRSLFSRNGVAAAAPPDGAPVKPEAAMALRGITLDENSFVAFVEDTTSHRVLTLHLGDGLASGHIQNLSLDELAFESGGKVLPIRVGQNLLGGLMPVAVAPPPAPPGPQPGSEPQPGAMPPGAMPPNGQRVVRGRPPVMEVAPG